MLNGRLRAAWGVTFLLTGIYVFAVLENGKRQRDASEIALMNCAHDVQNPGSPIIIIGSSLTYQAFPSETPEHGILGDDRSHQIWAMPNISLDETRHLMNCALQAGSETILIETNSIVFEKNVLANVQGQSNSKHLARLTRASQQFTNETDLLKYAFKSGSGVAWRSIFVGTPKRRGIWDGSRPSGAAVAEGLVEAQALDDFTNLSQTAKSQIYLFEPPRSQLYVQDTENTLGISMSDAFEDVQTVTGFRVLEFWRTWPNHYFTDYQSHMNDDGRALFISQLQNAWQRVENAY